MNKDDAARLLDRLRMRTQSRGATAAEAAAAAALAERIIERYGLDRQAGQRATESHVCDTVRLPGYQYDTAALLAFAEQAEVDCASRKKRDLVRALVQSRCKLPGCLRTLPAAVKRPSRVGSEE